MSSTTILTKTPRGNSLCSLEGITNTARLAKMTKTTRLPRTSVWGAVNSPIWFKFRISKKILMKRESDSGSSLHMAARHRPKLGVTKTNTFALSPIITPLPSAPPFPRRQGILTKLNLQYPISVGLNHSQRKTSPGNPYAAPRNSREE